MTKRHDNMLEAFRESSRIEETKPVPQPRPGEALSFPGTPERPADPPAERAAADTPPTEPRPKRGHSEAPDLVGVTGRSAAAAGPPPRPSKAPRGTHITIPLSREWFFGALVLSLTLVFMLGRWSAGSVVSAGPGDDLALAAAGGGGGDRATRNEPAGRRETGPLTPAPANPAGNGAGSGAREQVALTPAGRAFLDPTNIFTVVAITYDDSDSGRELAVATYRHLESAGFDVVYPRRKSGKLLIFVGAAPGYRDLERVEGELRRTRGPNGRLPFTGAYRVNIADYR